MQTFSFSFLQTTIDQLTDQQQQLLNAAGAAAEKAYAPYSSFRVGAAVLLHNGSIVTGANQENAAFPAGICAERAALAAIPVDAQHRIQSIAITYLPPDGSGKGPLAPCGICRQTILEAQQFQQTPIEVWMGSPDGRVLHVADAACLLPFHFGKAFL